MRQVFAFAGIANGTEGTTKGRCICEAIDFLRAVAGRLMSVSEEAGKQVHILEAAVLGKGEKRGRLPYGIMQWKFHVSVLVSATKPSKGSCACAATRRCLDYKVAAVVENVSGVDTASVAKLEPSFDTSGIGIAQARHTARVLGCEKNRAPI